VSFLCSFSALLLFILCHPQFNLCPSSVYPLCNLYLFSVHFFCPSSVHPLFYDLYVLSIFYLYLLSIFCTSSVRPLFILCPSSVHPTLSSVFSLSVFWTSSVILPLLPSTLVQISNINVRIGCLSLFQENKKVECKYYTTILVWSKDLRFRK
jgi:hypothetical protein